MERGLAGIGRWMHKQARVEEHWKVKSIEQYSNCIWGDLKVTAATSFGGLEVVCWPLVPKFAGSNPAEAVGFFRAKKSSARLPSEGQ